MSRASSRPRSILALSVFSLCLSATIAGTASHVLSSYDQQRSTNLWWLPIWPSHFDARGLETLIGASASLILLNASICGATFAKASSTRYVLLVLSSLAAITAVVEVAFPAAINNAAPGTDSMQTWTCQWASSAGSPSNFSALCHESRYAYFATIPVFVTHLLIVGFAVSNLSVARWQSRVGEEKGEELGSIITGGGHRDIPGTSSGKGSPEFHVYGHETP